MEKAKDLFEALATTPLEMAMLDNYSAGFVIPEYQRQYDWSDVNVDRLYYDTLNGFTRSSESKDPNVFTFIGTVILVKEATPEKDFGGVSYAIVDGQQRLTTLSLLACALHEELHYQFSELSVKFSATTIIDEWLAKEVEDRLEALYTCAVGLQRVTPKVNMPFPRIIRRGDSRARSKNGSEYKSAIARFLNDFASHFERRGNSEFTPPRAENKNDSKRLLENYYRIRELVGNLNNTNWYDDTECEQFEIRAIYKPSCRNLLVEIQRYFEDDSAQNSAFRTVEETPRLHSLMRTLLFASYFCHCIVLTRVITHDESAAFDIFDALNTTGEPLTAIETLKPRVISYENSLGEFAGSMSERAFATIQRNIDERFLETPKRQSETKDLIVTFALYLEGKKLSKDLATQRNFLRQSFDNAKKGTNGSESARRYVQALAEATEFRRYYWEREGIRDLGKFHTDRNVEEVKLLSSFISDMRTSLALPILERYWSEDLRDGNESEFLEVLRAVSAFIVLRRAATGGTDGIDSDFRAIMAPEGGRGTIRKFGLCAGVDHHHSPLRPSELKEALKALLKHKLKTIDKNSWVSLASRNPLYIQSREIVRFMILAAANQAEPSKVTPGTWNKSGIKVSAHINNFLDYKTWRSSLYATVEHVAPDKKPTLGWDSSLYQSTVLRHSIGNLILLPAKENSAIGSVSWEKKKLFYRALTEHAVSGQNEHIEEAKKSGIPFSKTLTDILDEQGRLSLLDPIRNVAIWDADLVYIRGENIAELCWDHIWPWLE